MQNIISLEYKSRAYNRKANGWERINIVKFQLKAT